MKRIAGPTALGTVVCFMCIGCGESWEAKTHPATGRITINGEPPAGALVQFHAIEEKPDVRNSRPWGVVQDDGTYRLSTYEQGDGAPAGEYALTITWPWDVSKPSFADRLNHVYVSPEKSKWRLTVSEGDNELPLVEITGAKVNRGSSPDAPGGVFMPGMAGEPSKR